jgi:hypothetical protein
MKYMLMMSGTLTEFRTFDTLRPDEVKAHFAFMSRVNQSLIESGEMVEGNGLAAPEQAKVVQVKAGSDVPVVSDGPFAESKEFLAGYWIVDVESAERALAIARHIATAPGRDGAPIGVPVEVRQVMSNPPGDV